MFKGIFDGAQSGTTKSSLPQPKVPAPTYAPEASLLQGAYNKLSTQPAIQHTTRCFAHNKLCMNRLCPKFEWAVYESTFRNRKQGISLKNDDFNNEWLQTLA